MRLQVLSAIPDHIRVELCIHAMRQLVMPIYQLEDIPEEFVTPKHSTAYGRLITGTQVEVGLLQYKAGEGAKQHAHPHEQVLLVLSGKCRLTLDGKSTSLTAAWQRLFLRILRTR